MAGWKKILSQPTSADVTVPDDSGSVALTGTATTQAFTSISTTGTSYFGNGFSSVNYLEGASIVKLQLNGASSTVEFAYNDGMDATSDGLIKLAGPVATGGETGSELIRLPIASGTVALTSDITGTNSGTNTGDVCTTNHTAAGYITSVADDTSPQLGGTLNPNGNSIIGTSSFLIGLTAEGSSDNTVTIRSRNVGGLGAGILWLDADEMKVSNVFKDEDNMLSNSDTAMASQQSIKAYVDSKSQLAFNIPFYFGGSTTVRTYFRDADDPSQMYNWNAYDSEGSTTVGNTITINLGNLMGGWNVPYDCVLESAQWTSYQMVATIGSASMQIWTSAPSYSTGNATLRANSTIFSNRSYLTTEQTMSVSLSKGDLIIPAFRYHSGTLPRWYGTLTIVIKEA